MEYAIRVRNAKEFDSAASGFLPSALEGSLPEGRVTALYFGSEFCENLIPSPGAAVECCKLAREHALEAVLLTPVVRKDGLRRVSVVLAALGARGYHPSVTFNDWGVARLVKARYPTRRIYGGRLLNRSLRDPRLLASAPARDESEGRSRVLLAFLDAFGADGLESDADLAGGFLGEGRPGFTRTLHLPFTFVTTGRNCLFKIEGDGLGPLAAEFKARCPRRCAGRVSREDREDTPFPLLRSGNTIFFEVPRDLATAHAAGADRIVLQREPLP